MMVVIRSFFFHMFFYLGTALMLFVFSPFILIPRPLFVPRIFTNYTRWLLKYIVGLDISIEGLENIPSDKPFLLVSNHQSAWETLMFFTIFKDPVMLLKKELTYIPLFGWFLWRTGMLSVDRNNPASAFKKLLAGIKARLNEEKRPVCVFPEGTRKIPGEPGDFKRGIYLIAKHTQADILCVAHNAGVYWPPHKFTIKPGTVKVFIYPVLAPVLDEPILKTVLPGMIHTKSKELARHGE